MRKTIMTRKRILAAVAAGMFLFPGIALVAHGAEDPAFATEVDLSANTEVSQTEDDKNRADNFTVAGNRYAENSDVDAGAQSHLYSSLDQFTGQLKADEETNVETSSANDQSYRETDNKTEANIHSSPDKATDAKDLEKNEIAERDTEDQHPETASPTQDEESEDEKPADSNVSADSILDEKAEQDALEPSEAEDVPESDSNNSDNGETPDTDSSGKEDEPNPDEAYEPNPKTGWNKIEEGWEYILGDGKPANDGWQSVDGRWYFFDKNGLMSSSCWIEGTYYVRADGVMAVDEWVDNCQYYVDGEGRWVKGKPVPAPKWQKDNTGWWLQRVDGSYVKSRWAKVYDQYYYFNHNGYMLTNSWVEGIYYVKNDGAMAVNQWVDNCKYYVDEEGRWVKGKPVPAPTWQKDSTGWWLKRADNSYPKNAWASVGDKYYYFNNNGYMLSNAWIAGVYYVRADGAMAVNEWVDNCQYYVDGEGRWVKGKPVPAPTWQKDSNGLWLKRADGSYLKNTWAKIDGEYYYLDDSGYMATNKVIDGVYFVKADGIMAKNELAGDGTNTYYLGADGKMKYGQQTIDGSRYCFDLKTGIMKTGLTSLDTSYSPEESKIVYYGPDGKMQTGVLEIDGKRMVFEHKSGALKSGFLKLNQSYGYPNSVTVYSNKYGVMQFGEQKIEGYWYCFDLKTGVMKTGFVDLDASYTKRPKTVYYDSNGRMVYGKQTIEGKTYYFDNVTGALKSTIPDIKNVSYTVDDDGNITGATRTNVNYMRQTDPRWSNYTMNGYTVGSTGCAATVMTMVINALKETSYAVNEIAAEATVAGYMNTPSYMGMGGQGINYLSSLHGLKVRKNLTSSGILNALKDGGLVTCAMGQGTFVNTGNAADTHEILIYGYDGTKVKVYDPYFTSHNGTYNLSTIMSQPSRDVNDCAQGGPFFGIFA